MRFNIITLMPELIASSLEFGVVGKAFKKGLCQLNLINPREFSTDVHQTVDDRPFGGGDGMLMMAEPLQKALEACETTGDIYYLSPQGEVLNDSLIRKMSEKKEITLICGRYGGVDQRFLKKNNIQELSIGDYVLSGGELASLVVVDSVTRQIPGVLGHSASANEDSFADGLLEAPFFTRPQQWQGMDVPAILLCGDHKKIHFYKTQMSLLVTFLKRPDLLKGQKVDWSVTIDYLEKAPQSEIEFLSKNREELISLIKENFDV